MADVTALSGQLQDTQTDVRAAAAEQLAQMGESARPAAVSLVRATGDTESVSTWAVAALEELGPPASEAIPELDALTAHDLELVSYWAVTLLGRLESDAAPAEEALASALSSSQHMSVRQRSAWALGRLDELCPSTVASLQRASQGSDPRLAQLAARALAAGGQNP